MGAGYIEHHGQPYGYRAGRRMPVRYLVDASSEDIKTGNAITVTGMSAGYVGRADGSGDRVIGFAMEDVDSPSADGEASVLVDVSTESIYEVPPDSGTLTTAELLDSCDIGADGFSIDRDASVTDDIQILSIDTNLNTALIKRLDVGIPGVA